MDKPTGNVGRSRGRAGGSNNPAASGRRGRRTPQVSQVPGGTPTTQASGPVPSTSNPSVGRSRDINRGGANLGASQPTSVTQQRPPAPVALGRASAHRNAPTVDAPQGGAEAVDNRGVVRGKRVFNEIVNSRPQDLLTKCGTSGSKVTVKTNYFRIMRKPNWSIHQYRVDFSPDVDMKHLRRAYLHQHKALFGGYIFDGTVMFCTNVFVDLAGDGKKELLTKNREGEIIQIKIKHVGIVDVSDVQQIQVLNLILRRAMECLNMDLIRRNYYDSQAKISLDLYKLDLWPGYETSIRQHEKDILLCAEVTHKVVRNETLLNIFNEVRRDHQNIVDKYKERVVGSVVLTSYNNKSYRVHDVDFNLNPSSKFKMKNEEISYTDYYLRRYNIKIRDLKQPLLVSQPKEKNIRAGEEDLIMLIPELCQATGLTDVMKDNFKLMRAMSDYTRLTPDRRIQKLMNLKDRLYKNAASMEIFKLWNMELDSALVEIPGRILTSEKIFFGNNNKVVSDRNADWTREFRKTSMYAQVDISRWYVILPRRNIQEVQTFVKMCIQAAHSMKMRISEPRYEELSDDRSGMYSQAIDKTTAQDPQILMVVLGFGKNEERYSCVKKRCCVDRPIPSQVVTLKTIAPRSDRAGGLMSIATKVVIQMNAKLLGAPWLIEMPLNGLMAVGFDVCHINKDKNKSYGALVATMDIKRSTKYFSAVTEHLKGQELSNDICVKMTNALKSYRATHGTLPERIVFYRDGVGDGQLHQVFHTEVKALKGKLNEIYQSAGVEKGYRFAFVVVSKRINTRYFVNSQNPPPGTVVDDIITLPERYDFFLVSQSVRQGTVSPTSYNIIFDNLGLGPDKMQILTYKMTHLYYNWSGTLRVPAVCQYAHKLAFLVAESIKRAPSNVLENQLYFL